MSGVKEKVAECIRKKGWSIVTTSERSGVPTATIKSIIYGHSTTPKTTTLEKLASVFECSVGDLIEENNSADFPKMDSELFKECIDAVELYSKKNKLTLHKDKMMKVIESLSSLMIKKKVKQLPYSIDDDTIEWIIDNIV